MKSLQFQARTFSHMHVVQFEIYRRCYGRKWVVFAHSKIRVSCFRRKYRRYFLAEKIKSFFIEMQTLFEMHVICGEPSRRCAGGNTAVMLKKWYFWIHARTVFARILEQEEFKFWCEKIKSFRRRIRNFCSSNVGVFETCRRCYEQKACFATQTPLTAFDFSTEISTIFLKSHNWNILKANTKNFWVYTCCMLRRF